MIDLRLRSRISPAEMESKVGKILTLADFNVLLTGAARVLKPDGQLLCVYVPGAITEAAIAAYPLLAKVRGNSKNRNNASGTIGPTKSGPAGNIHVVRPVMSTILGAVDPAVPRFPHCRLTAFTAQQADTWEGMQPYWRAIAEVFQTHVPERYAVQAREAARTRSEWIIQDTPFTTVTVNNSYSTGVHKDKGDLDSGFSCLSVCRRGEYTGGELVFPEYRLAVSMQDGDVMLMDAHSWHGNVAMRCACGGLLPGGAEQPKKQLVRGPCTKCGAERISVVCYFRTRMTACGSPDEEYSKRLAQKDMPVTG